MTSEDYMPLSLWISQLIELVQASDYPLYSGDIQSIDTTIAIGISSSYALVIIEAGYGNANRFPALFKKKIPSNS